MVESNIIAITKDGILLLTVDSDNHYIVQEMLQFPSIYKKFEKCFVIRDKQVGIFFSNGIQLCLAIIEILHNKINYKSILTIDDFSSISYSILPVALDNDTASFLMVLKKYNDAKSQITELKINTKNFLIEYKTIYEFSFSILKMVKLDPQQYLLYCNSI